MEVIIFILALALMIILATTDVSKVSILSKLIEDKPDSIFLIMFVPFAIGMTALTIGFRLIARL